MVGLGDLLGGMSYSYGRGVSADGSVVVGASGAEGGQKAFVWTPTHGMRCLQDVLTDSYKLNLTGWTLESANAVTPDGTVIVGTGRNPAGQTEAWRVDLRAMRVKVWRALVNVFYDPSGFGLNTTQGMGQNAVACDAIARLEAFALEPGHDFATMVWSYDEAELAAKGIDERRLRLFWLDEALQVPGATGALWYPGGTTASGGYGAGIDVGDTALAPDAFAIGCYGINTAEDYVWANINHGLTYALAGPVIPEPGTLGLLTLGGVGLWRRRRRRYGRIRPENTSLSLSSREPKARG
jgi:probable HAF family extracellular repeat protein